MNPTGIATGVCRYNRAQYRCVRQDASHRIAWCLGAQRSTSNSRTQRKHCAPYSTFAPNIIPCAQLDAVGRLRRGDYGDVGNTSHRRRRRGRDYDLRSKVYDYGTTAAFASRICNKMLLTPALLRAYPLKLRSEDGFPGSFVFCISSTTPPEPNFAASLLFEPSVSALFATSFFVPC